MLIQKNILITFLLKVWAYCIYVFKNLPYFFTYAYTRPLSYSQKNFVFSLTSSPKRISYLHYIFNNLPIEVPIFLHLPEKFKNKELYSFNHIVSLQKRFKQLIINRIPNDLGPQTKLLGLYYASPEVKNFLTDKHVLVIDDDTVYPNNILDLYNNTINLNQNNQIFAAKIKEYNEFTIPQGHGSFALKYTLLTQDFLQRSLQYSKLKGCELHDDFVFAAVYKDLGYTIFNVKDIKELQLLYGYGDDALHLQEYNVNKNSQCYKSIQNQCEI